MAKVKEPTITYQISTQKRCTFQLHKWKDNAFTRMMIFYFPMTERYEIIKEKYV